MCATSRKRIGVLALSCTVCVTRLARQHGASRAVIFRNKYFHDSLLESGFPVLIG